MNPLREAAQQALEALEKTHTQPGCEQWQAERKASVALRAALAQQEQEPVPAFVHRELVEVHADGTETWSETPLCAAQPRREWRSLSEEEIHDCFQQRHKDKATERRMIALAVEQALRSKNK
jgi:hypothetical protein